MELYVKQGSNYTLATDQTVLDSAAFILRPKVGELLDSCNSIREYLRVKFATLEYEIFGVIYLDSQLRYLNDEVLFRGTIDQTRVYPREILKNILANNASSVCLYHNHPSGCNDPSNADLHLTKLIQTTLAMIDSSVIDHFIVAREGILSFRERGLM